jgi:hypothetical protein
LNRKNNTRTEGFYRRIHQWKKAFAILLLKKEKPQLGQAESK